MNWFAAETKSDGVVPADRAEVWRLLTDPDTVAEMTPLLAGIEADGDLWRWRMTRLPVLGMAFCPEFTERMKFVDQERIDYSHAPPPGSHETAGAEGWYELSDVDDGTHLAIGLTIKVALPLPRASGPAVRAAMRAVFATMGAGFSRNLHRRLDAG